MRTVFGLFGLALASTGGAGDDVSMWEDLAKRTGVHPAQLAEAASGGDPQVIKDAAGVLCRTVQLKSQGWEGAKAALALTKKYWGEDWITCVSADDADLNVPSTTRRIDVPTSESLTAEEARDLIKAMKEMSDDEFKSAFASSEADIGERLNKKSTLSLEDATRRLRENRRRSSMTRVVAEEYHHMATENFRNSSAVPPRRRISLRDAGVKFPQPKNAQPGQGWEGALGLSDDLARNKDCMVYHKKEVIIKGILEPELGGWACMNRVNLQWEDLYLTATIGGCLGSGLMGQGTQTIYGSNGVVTFTFFKFGIDACDVLGALIGAKVIGPALRSATAAVGRQMGKYIGTKTMKHRLAKKFVESKFAQKQAQKALKDQISTCGAIRMLMNNPAQPLQARLDDLICLLESWGGKFGNSLARALEGVKKGLDVFKIVGKFFNALGISDRLQNLADAFHIKFEVPGSWNMNSGNFKLQGKIDLLWDLGKMINDVIQDSCNPFERHEKICEKVKKSCGPVSFLCEFVMACHIRTIFEPLKGLAAEGCKGIANLMGPLLSDVKFQENISFDIFNTKIGTLNNALDFVGIDPPLGLTPSVVAGHCDAIISEATCRTFASTRGFSFNTAKYAQDPKGCFQWHNVVFYNPLGTKSCSSQKRCVCDPVGLQALAPTQTTDRCDGIITEQQCRDWAAANGATFNPNRNSAAPMGCYQWHGHDANYLQVYYHPSGHQTCSNHRRCICDQVGGPCTKDGSWHFNGRGTNLVQAPARWSVQATAEDCQSKCFSTENCNYWNHFAQTFDEFIGWTSAGHLESTRTTGISRAACQAMVKPEGGYYYDSVNAGGFCVTYEPGNVAQVRAHYGTSTWVHGQSYQVTYLPRPVRRERQKVTDSDGACNNLAGALSCMRCRKYKDARTIFTRYDGHDCVWVPSKNKCYARTDASVNGWQIDEHCDAKSETHRCIGNPDGEIGDGVGGHEEWFGNGFSSMQACVEKVKKERATANGATFNPNGGACFAEFGQTWRHDWNGQSPYRNCLIETVVIQAMDKFVGWTNHAHLVSAQTTGITKVACQAMVKPGGGYYYDSVNAGGWCRTIEPGNVAQVRASYPSSWTHGHQYQVTYLPRQARNGDAPKATCIGNPDGEKGDGSGGVEEFLGNGFSSMQKCVEKVARLPTANGATFNPTDGGCFAEYDQTHIWVPPPHFGVTPYRNCRITRTGGVTILARQPVTDKDGKCQHLIGGWAGYQSCTLCQSYKDASNGDDCVWVPANKMCYARNEAVSYGWQIDDKCHAGPNCHLASGSGSPVWMDYGGPEPYTYSSAQAFCENQGGALCSRDQYCIGGQGGSLLAGAGDMAQGDKWAPVADNDNSWVQSGQAHRLCWTHTELGYGRPAWGRTGSSYGRRLCCVQPAATKDLKTEASGSAYCGGRWKP